MSTLDAWQFILNNWNTPVWKSIPETVRQALSLAPSVGMFSGMLVTRAGSEGITSFVYRMNHRKAG